MRRQNAVRIAVWLVAGCGFAWLAGAQDAREEHPLGAMMVREAGGAAATPRFLPLKLTDVRLDVYGALLQARVTQVFVNDTTNTLEAAYVFPLPAGAAVMDMELLVGNRRIRSVVRERQEARQVYEQARSEGRRAALVEQERPNQFTTSVANFAPGETARVTFTYAHALDYQRGLYTLLFPMVVGPRYLALPDPTAATLPADARPTPLPPATAPVADPGHRLSLDVTLHGLPIDRLESTTHPISSRSEGNAWRVTLRDGVTVPNADFALQIHLAPDAGPRLSFLQSPGTNESYGLLTVLPPAGAAETQVPQPRDVVFIVDTSGSMDGESIAQARAGLTLCLAMLTPFDRFTIVRFSSDYSAFTPDLVDATPANLAAARGYVAGLSASGGTEMLPALRYVLNRAMRPDASRLVVFLTDGCVDNEQDLMRLIGDSVRDARLFTFGIGSAPNEHLMRRMAELGRGQCRFIRTAQDISSVLADFFRTLSTPALTDITLTWLGADGQPRTDVRAYPDPAPNVFLDRPLEVVACAPGGFSGSLLVRGRAAGRTVSFACPLSAGVSAPAPCIDKLFGRGRIEDLSTQMIFATNDTETTALRAALLETALHHQLVSPYTSRVAVEEQVERAPDGQLVSVRVPSTLPRGWEAGRVPTATADGGQLIAAAGLLTLAIALRRAMRPRREQERL